MNGVSLALVAVLSLAACAQSPAQVCQTEYGLYPGDADYGRCVGAIAARQQRANTALMATGLGMMASPSPYPGVAVGEGALTGLQTYESGR